MFGKIFDKFTQPTPLDLEANLSEAKLRGVNLRRRNLSFTILSEAGLAEANLECAPMGIRVNTVIQPPSRRE